MIAALVQAEAAAAHATQPTVALDYRVSLTDATEALAGLHIAVIDGDRALRLHVDPSTELVVRGLLGEPFIRFSATGVWVNGRSPTATANKLIKPSTSESGWRRLTAGHSFTWHDHRLSPPPGLATGSSAPWMIPITLGGRPTAISGTITRVPRPPIWPWVAAGLVAVLVILAVARAAPDRRGAASAALAAIAATGTVATSAAIATGDGAGGPGAWMLVIGAGLLVLAVAAIPLVSNRSARYWAAAILAALILMIALPFVAVFAHGVVISSMPADVVRLSLAISLVAGLAAIPLGVLAGEQEGELDPALLPGAKH